jgi:thiamine-phosphate pyrophosphorylase
MRAAALVRLAGPTAIALGGMDERRFRGVRALGFQGWAGIDAWLAKTRT